MRFHRRLALVLMMAMLGIGLGMLGGPARVEAQAATGTVAVGV